MCNIFLKFNIENDLGDYLALNHPNAFMLLYFIARRARRIPGQADGLKIGECHIGDHQNYGLTESEYRTAKKILVSNNVIQIVETCRNRKKLTTGMTTVGTLVRLLDSKVWDINPKEDDDRFDDRLTTGSRPDRDRMTTNKEREEEIRKEEKENIARLAPRPRSNADILFFDSEKAEYGGIEEKDLLSWKEIYPHIDVKIEISRSIDWIKSNPSKSKKKLWRKFLTGWFSRANETAERKKAFKVAAMAGTDRKAKDIDGNPVENQYKGRF